MKLAEYERNYDYAIAQKTAIESAAAVQQQQAAEAQEAQETQVALPVESEDS